MARNLRLIRVSDDSGGSCFPGKNKIHTQANVVIRLKQKHIMLLETTADSVVHEGGLQAEA